MAVITALGFTHLNLKKGALSSSTNSSAVNASDSLYVHQFIPHVVLLPYDWLDDTSAVPSTEVLKIYKHSLPGNGCYCFKKINTSFFKS